MEFRDKILVLMSGIFLGNGLSILLSPNAITYASLDPSIKAHLKILNVVQIGWAFVILGTLSLLCVLFKKLPLGYGLLMFQTTFWTLLYFVSWAETGFWRAIFGAAQYIFLSGMLFLCSRVVESQPLPPSTLTTPASLERLFNEKEEQK